MVKGKAWFRIKDPPSRVSVPYKGTERVVKTIEDRWGKYSTVGQLHPLSPEFFCPLVRGTEGVVKTFKPIKNIKRN